MSVKPLLILKSPLSGNFYATRAYKITDYNKGNLVVTGKKDDVTYEIQGFIDQATAELKELLTWALVELPTFTIGSDNFSKYNRAKELTTDPDLKT